DYGGGFVDCAAGGLVTPRTASELVESCPRCFSRLPWPRGPRSPLSPGCGPRAELEPPAQELVRLRHEASRSLRIFSHFSTCWGVSSAVSSSVRRLISL